MFGTGKDSEVSLHGEVFVQRDRPSWSRMQKELQGVRIFAVDRFTDSK